MPKLKFRDMKAKTSFETDDFKVEERMTKAGIRYFAIAVAPSGVDSYRIISKDMYEQSK